MRLPTRRAQKLKIQQDEAAHKMREIVIQLTLQLQKIQSQMQGQDPKKYNQSGITEFESHKVMTK